MILGLSVPMFTFIHVVISLIGIAAGFVWLGGLVVGSWLPRWNAVFLITTIATSVTGFFFHSAEFGPPHVIGVISLVTLAIALGALLVFHRQNTWRLVYTGTAVFALYLNTFVGIVQSFQKVALLRTLAPTQAEPPFFVAQGVVFAAFLVLGFLAIRQSKRPAAA